MHLLPIIKFATLAGSAGATVIPRQSAYAGYLLNTFTDANHTGLQYLSQGNSPYNFRPLNGGEPVFVSEVGTKGIRDNFLTTNPARSEWYVITTDLDIRVPGFDWGEAQTHGSRALVIWKSTDLLTWTGGDLVTVEDDTAGMVWAPSAVWNDKTEEWLVFWSSRHYAADDPDHTGPATLNRIRYATTRDFVTFSDPQDYLYLSETSLIDQEFQYLGTPDHYARFIKNETLGKVYRETTTKGLFGTWDRIPGYITDDFSHEGAASFQDNENADLYHLLIDTYQQYVPYETTDILEGPYTPVEGDGIPYGLKHGSVTPLTAAEYNALNAKYPV